MSQSFIIFYHIFKKKYRQMKKNIVLSKLQGGENILKLIDIFFIIYFINILITLYSIYTFFEIKIFHNQQGSKLKLKIRRFS